MSEVVEERARTRWLALEVLVAFLTSAAFFATCFSIRVKALDRVGQVSGLASLGFRFTLAAAALVLILIVAARWRAGAHFDRASALVCAAAAGLVSGMVAGGILVALHGTPYGLAGNTGDTIVLSTWAHDLQLGKQVPAIYPPLHIYGIAWISDLFHIPTAYAMKQFQLLALLIVTPVAYSAWRLLLRPVWALGVGVTISLPFIEAYRLYPFVVLLAFLPMILRFLDILRHAADHEPRWIAQRGALFGLGFGVLFLLYSGWYQWSAPGVFVAVLVVFPWKTAPKLGALFCAIAALVFVAVSWNYLVAILHGPAIKDNFMYFDSQQDPAYIAMWRGNAPGAHANLWPPLGELGGVGLFTVLLAVGFGAAVALGRKTTAVIALSSIMLGAWLMRFWYAHSMWDTGLVQLYPRTTAELLYCLLAMSGLAIYYGVERKQLAGQPAAVIGVACGLLFLYGQAGSAISDKYMARAGDDEYGHLSWIALNTPAIGKNQTMRSTVSPSSVADDPAFAPIYLVDNKPDTAFSSSIHASADETEVVEIHFPITRTFSKVVLVPAGDGWPVDYTIEVSDGFKWYTRVTRTGDTLPAGPIELSLGQTDRAGLMRLRATRLGSVAGGYALRLAELKVFQ
jgi:galactan 5-O-arabinofuranosyltransferase